LKWMRDLAARRSIDWRPLHGYDQVRREFAECLADTFAIDTLARWCLQDGPTERPVPVNLLVERMAAKNIASVTAWRVLDRAMSLLAGEGFETAASKAARGAPPVPLERAFRDARGFRISGGVDFLLDLWGSLLVTLPRHAGPGGAEVPVPGGLSARNRGHVAELDRQAGRFARTVRDWTAAHPPAELAERQHELILANQVLNELTTGALVLARAAGADEETQALADVYCDAARHRLADLWSRLDTAGSGPDHAAVAARWLDGTGYGHLADDLVPEEYR
jgi:hypothetical protein